MRFRGEARDRWVTCLVALVFAGARASRAETVAQMATSGRLAPESLAIVDPVVGSSSGTVGSDVRLAVGDVIVLRFDVASLPVGAVRGIQSYATVFVPGGTELVGARLVDGDGAVVEPRRAGPALDGCNGGSLCNTVLGYPTGSIAQVHADTGIFVSTDPRTARTPPDQLLTLDAGIEMSPEPAGIDPEIVAALGDTSGIYYAHSEWDWDQASAFGALASPFADGDGNTPFAYGSPVAGPQTYYRFEATDDGTLGLDGVDGPWERIVYPGSQIGTGVSNIGSTSTVTRVGVDTASGVDLSPANARAANAVRFALGEARVGELRAVEVALRVVSLPVEPNFGSEGANVVCAEVFGGDASSKDANNGGEHNPWPQFVAAPVCTFLRAPLAIGVDELLASTGDVLHYSIDFVNLSVDAENSAEIVARYPTADLSLVAAQPSPSSSSVCAGDGASTCLTWELGTLDAGETVALALDLQVTAATGTMVVHAAYSSTELSALDPAGQTARAVTVIAPVAAPRITLGNALDPTSSFAVSPSNSWQIEGQIVNDGTATWSAESLTFVLPSASWGLFENKVSIDGADVACTATGVERTCATALAWSAAQARTLQFRLVVPGSLAAGLYPVGVRARGSQSVLGSFETDFPRALLVPVGSVRSEVPALDCPIEASDAVISGASEPAAEIDLHFERRARGSATASVGGEWTSSDYGAFGGLYAGLEVRANAQAPGELTSELSAACAVGPPCSPEIPERCDGWDNDCDAKTADGEGDPAVGVACGACSLGVAQCDEGAVICLDLSGCLFTDGFESEDTLAWSSAVP